MLDGHPAPAWQQRALAGLTASPVFDVTPVRLGGRVREGPLRHLHAALEQRVFRLGPDALAPVDFDQGGVAAAQEHPRAQSLDERLAGDEPIVWLADAPAPADESRELVLVSHNGAIEPAERAVRRALSAAADCIETDVILRRAGRTVVLERTVSGLRSYSPTLTANMLLWKLATMLPRAVERLPGALDAAVGPAPAPGAIAGAPATGGDAPSAPAALPRAASPAALLARSAIAWLRILTARALFSRPWTIRLRRRTDRPTDGWAEQSPLVRWRAANMYADPFLFEHEGRHHLFCEEVVPGSARGVISHTELALDGSLAAAPEPVLTAEHHLSYPFVFAHEGEVFMIPETSAVKRVELYRAVEFPHRWERDSVLIDALDAADATLLAHEDRLWLFAAVTPPDASSLDELHIYSAEELRGPWLAHPRNPVVSDVRRARPAGAFQRWGARLVRPGQDGRSRYGGAISFQQVDVLSAEEYAEHEIARLDPADAGDARATHTYAADASFEAIDVRRRRARWTPSRRARA